MIFNDEDAERCGRNGAHVRTLSHSLALAAVRFRAEEDIGESVHGLTPGVYGYRNRCIVRRFGSGRKKMRPPPVSLASTFPGGLARPRSRLKSGDGRRLELPCYFAGVLGPTVALPSSCVFFR